MKSKKSNLALEFLIAMSEPRIIHFLESHQEEAAVEIFLRIKKLSRSKNVIHQLFSIFDISLEEVKSWKTELELQDELDDVKNIDKLITLYNQESGD